MTLLGNADGLAIERGTDNRIEASAASGNGHNGFVIGSEYGTSNTLTRNTATGNEVGFRVAAVGFRCSSRTRRLGTSGASSIRASPGSPGIESRTIWQDNTLETASQTCIH